MKKHNVFSAWLKINILRDVRGYLSKRSESINWLICKQKDKNKSTLSLEVPHTCTWVSEDVGGSGLHFQKEVCAKSDWSWTTFNIFFWIPNRSFKVVRPFPFQCDWVDINDFQVATTMDNQNSFSVRPPMLAIFTILQTLLILVFTADSLHVLSTRSSRCSAMNPMKQPATGIMQFAFVLDATIVSTLATNIVVSLTFRNGISYSCFKTDLRFLIRVVTIVWISIGITIARLTLAEILSTKNEKITMFPEKFTIFTKILTTYTALSVWIFVAPFAIQHVPVVDMCFPFAERTYQDAVVCSGIVAVLFFAICIKAKLFCEKHSQNSGLSTKNRDQILKVHLTNSCLNVFGIIFLTLLPFVLSNLKTSQSFSVYKLFAFYVFLSLSNLSASKVYNSLCSANDGDRYFVV